MVTGPQEFAQFGLEPIGPTTRPSELRPVRCLRCSTVRWVRLTNLRRGGIGCQWCHGWQKWPAWADNARTRAERWRPIRGVDFSEKRLIAVHLAPLTEVGDEFTPVGVVCLVCGDVDVVVPERISDKWPCGQCYRRRRAGLRHDAPDVFRAHGLELLGICRGEFVPQAARCLKCDSIRSVSFRRLVEGTAPLCWVCTYGIRPDEPHRVYLVRFPDLQIWKVGLTHSRHDRRLHQHQIQGGEVVQTITVPNRTAARQLERAVLSRYEPWRADGHAPDFPQGGWTETWLDNDDAPPCDLTALLEFVERPGEH
jgi:hypothetical protein